MRRCSALAPDRRDPGCGDDGAFRRAGKSKRMPEVPRGRERREEVAEVGVMVRRNVWCLLMHVIAAAGADSGYTGSKVCAECHRELYDRYVRSAMGQSMRPVTDQRDLVRV